MGSVTKETFSGMKWMTLQKCTLQPLQLVFGMLLARLVTPEEIGILGLTAIFFAISNSLICCGFSSALIRKTNRTDVDINTMFWYNISMSAVLSTIIFFASPLFVIFFKQPALLWLTRASACMMFISSIAHVQWTLLTCERNFKTHALINTGVAIASMPICIGLAYAGWGTWAIMTQSLFSATANSAIVWIISPWKPKFRFSWNSFKELFGYGAKLSLAGLLDTIFENARSLIIGRYYTPADLAYYDKGQHVAAIIPATFSSTLNHITFPILSTLQNEPQRLKEVFRKYNRLFTLTITWTCLCISAYAKPIVAILYGSQWGEAVIFTQITCFTFCIGHLLGINQNLMKVLGYAGLYLKVQFIVKIISLAVMIACATINVYAMCIGSVICTHVALFVSAFYAKKIANLKLRHQFMDYCPLFFLGGASTWGIAWFFLQLPTNSFIQVALGATLSFLIYFGLLYILKSRSLNDLISILCTTAPDGFVKKYLKKLHREIT